MQMNRRKWLQTAGAGCLVATPLPVAAARPVASAIPVAASKAGSELSSGGVQRIAAQAYVFSQFHARRGERLGDFAAAMLRSHADAGIFQVELLADLVAPDVLPTVRRECMATGVRIPAVYAGALLYEPGRQAEAIRTTLRIAGHAAEAGARFLNCNPQPKPRKQPKTDDELAREAEGIRRLAEGVRAEGLTLLLHQHDAEMLEEARNWRYWLQHTDPRNVRICFDSHWAYRGGRDALELLKECRSRLESLHLRNSRAGVWGEFLDDGDLDYRPIAECLQETQYEGLLTVELAWETGMTHARSLVDNLRLSRQYTERRFLSAAS